MLGIVLGTESNGQPDIVLRLELTCEFLMYPSVDMEYMNKGMEGLQVTTAFPLSDTLLDDL